MGREDRYVFSSAVAKKEQESARMYRQKDDDLEKGNSTRLDYGS